MKTAHRKNLLVHPPQWLCYGGRAAAFVGALAFVSTSARADDTMATPTATSEVTPAAASAMTLAAKDADAWQFGVTVPLWAPQIDGNTTSKGVQQDVNISFDQLKDHLDASFSLAVDLRKGKFGIYGDVGYMKFSGNVMGSSGDKADIGLKFLVSDAGVSYLLVKSGETHPFVLEGTLGLRYWYIDTSVTVRDPGGNVLLRGGKTYDLYDPVIGLRGSQYLTRKLHLDFSGDFGGFNISHDTDLTWSATGVLTWDFAKWFSLSAGYKALAVDESQGSGASKNGLNLIFHGALITANFKF